MHKDDDSQQEQNLDLFCFMFHRLLAAWRDVVQRIRDVRRSRLFGVHFTHVLH